MFGKVIFKEIVKGKEMIVFKIVVGFMVGNGFVCEECGGIMYVSVIFF